MKTSLKCRCGHHIARRDVMQRRTVHHVRQSYVYLKYRCSYCKKVGELYINPDDWSDHLLLEGKGEVSHLEKRHFARLGDITFHEMRQFHRALESLGGLPATPEEE